MKVSATTIDYDPSRRRYSCQGRFSFDPSLLSEAIRRYALRITLVEPKAIDLMLVEIAEKRDPTRLLAEWAKRTEGIEKCFNTNRIFYLQPTSESQFIVTLDKNTLDKNTIVPGCRALISRRLTWSMRPVAPRELS